MNKTKRSNNTRKKASRVKPVHEQRSTRAKSNSKQFKDPLVFNSSKKKFKNEVRSLAYTVNKTRKMNWKQLKKKYPGLSPTSDADFDGLVNAKDCKPLDPSKDGKLSAFLGMIQDDKSTARGLVKAVAARKIGEQAAERRAKVIVKDKGYISQARIKRIEKVERAKRMFKSKAAEAIEDAARRVTPTTRREIAAASARRRKGMVKAVERFAGVKETQAKGKSAKGQAQAGAGRPKQSYKYRDPRTGQPISAVEYHRLRKQLKSQAKAVENRTEVKQRFALAKRGLSPEEVAAEQEKINARMAQLRAIKAAKQQATQAEAPQDIEVTQDGQVVETQELPEQEVVQRFGEGDEAIEEEQVVDQDEERLTRHEVAQRVPGRPQAIPRSRFEPMLEVPGSHGIPQGYRVRDDIMTGRRTLVRLPQQEAWMR